MHFWVHLQKNLGIARILEIKSRTESMDVRTIMVPGEYFEDDILIRLVLKPLF